MSAVPPNRPFSGKRLTIVLMLILLSTGGLFYWVTTSYSAYNAARRQTDRDWRELASLLENRYRVIDKRIAEGVEQHKLDGQLPQQWRLARDSFTATGISSLQIESAEKVESVVASLRSSLSLEDTLSDELKQAVSQYDESAKRQREIGQTLGSRVLRIMLNLPDPKDIQLN